MTQYTYHEVTPELIGDLWANMWARGEEELARHGFSKEQALLRYLDFAQRGYGRIVCADGVPVTVVGVASEHGENFTFMQATTEFDDHYLEVMRFIRKFLKKHPGELNIYSVALHPQTEGFFRVLGFKRDTEWQGMTAAGYPLFRFKRNRR